MYNVRALLFFRVQKLARTRKKNSISAASGALGKSLARVQISARRRVLNYSAPQTSALTANELELDRLLTSSACMMRNIRARKVCTEKWVTRCRCELLASLCATCLCGQTSEQNLPSVIACRALWRYVIESPANGIRRNLLKHSCLAVAFRLR